MKAVIPLKLTIKANVSILNYAPLTLEEDSTAFFTMDEEYA